MERELKMLEVEYDKACAEWLDANKKCWEANYDYTLGDTSETERDKARAELEKADTKRLLAALRNELGRARSVLEAESAEHAKQLEAECAEHAQQLLAMRRLRFQETGRVIAEMKGEADRLKAELGVAKETASRFIGNQCSNLYTAVDMPA
jgi:hypothetical protein